MNPKLYFILKAVISGLLVAAISFLSDRYRTIGAALASVPILSVLALIWMKADKVNPDKISAFSMSVFWLAIPSLAFFPLFSFFMLKKLGFTVSLTLSLTAMITAYFLMILLLGKAGIKI